MEEKAWSCRFMAKEMTNCNRSMLRFKERRGGGRCSDDFVAKEKTNCDGLHPSLAEVRRLRWKRTRKYGEEEL